MTEQGALCATCHRAAVVAQLPTEKTCLRCERTLPVEDFGLRKARAGASKWRSRCRECEATESRMYAKHAQRVRAEDRESVSYTALRRYAKQLGIPWAEVVERYPSDNRCEICRRTPQEANPGGRYFRLSLDHCHETNALRGFLCGPCNSGVGHLGDTLAHLRAALKYLTKAESRARASRDTGVDQDPIPGT